MAKYTVKQVSSMINISKDTLRYYDKLGLLSPNREENKYRVYTDENLMELMYIQVLKYADFSLAEILKMSKKEENHAEFEACKAEIIHLLENKRQQITEKINHYNKITELLGYSIDVVKSRSEGEKDKIDQLVLQIYEGFKNETIKE